MEKPEVSLVISTRNRAEKLRSCLDYIARQQPSCAWELVVVDNGSTDGTRQVLDEFAARAAFPVAVLFKSKPGLGRAHNVGWRAARSDIIAITDDDCYIAADYIDRVRETFSDPKIGFAGGRVDLFDPTDIPMTIRTSDQRELFKPQSFIEGGALLGANMMFRRRVLEELGGFDPDLGPGARFHGEEMDAQTRASFAGWWGLYTPEVIVAHHHGRKAKDAPKLLQTYVIGQGAYTAKCMLAPESRRVVMPVVARNWYWLARKAVRRGGELRWLLWEMQGFAGYLGYWLRKRIHSVIWRVLRPILR
ncbi:MAG TPA: glycosyltransferase [Xanthobacteraceae bacterium]|nr:glycosyltransferase [Xanthobacteraceae bacterium]HUO00288.1 glycosyltransferase [Bradyrhizobium sp.]